jgi:hypothetical protein
MVVSGTSVVVVASVVVGAVVVAGAAVTTAAVVSEDDSSSPHAANGPTNAEHAIMTSALFFISNPLHLVSSERSVGGKPRFLSHPRS